MKIPAFTILLFTGIFSLYLFCASSSAPGNIYPALAAAATPVPANRDISREAVRQNEASAKRPNYRPKEGYVPDEQTAVAVAVAIWTPIYGKEKIENEKPYRAGLKNGVWTVRGSLPEGFDGGVAEIDIAKDDGRILRVMHGK